MARKNNFEKIILATRTFHLTSYFKIKKPGAPLHVYLEGDGLAWISKSRLSEDPTPRQALVLKLAAEDPADNVAYLARPCQYDSRQIDACCGPVYWSSKRFSEEVIASTDEAIELLKNKSAAKEIYLAGYSGGGAVAVLVAARRHDVVSLSTIAGNLDHEALSRYHHVSFLSGSLNPLHFTAQVRDIPQEHLVGGKDQVVPRFIAQNFLNKIQNPLKAKIIDVPEASHQQGWEEEWRKHLRRVE